MDLQLTTTSPEFNETKHSFYNPIYGLVFYSVQTLPLLFCHFIFKLYFAAKIYLVELKASFLAPQPHALTGTSLVLTAEFTFSMELCENGSFFTANSEWYFLRKNASQSDIKIEMYMIKFLTLENYFYFRTAKRSSIRQEIFSSIH